MLSVTSHVLTFKIPSCQSLPPPPSPLYPK
uniref:Uncharacterized protein n=1 Tax=Anguilla anguilla TaxID=7936 RepID=A0A0E9QI98_ANGAN